MQTADEQLREACQELEQRLRRGEGASAEDYRTGRPDLWRDEDAALELIFTEMVVRAELGLRRPAEEWMRRYPQWRDRLQRLLEIHGALDAEDADTSAAGDTEAVGLRWWPAPGSRRVGSYELLEEVDRGGMGVVYKARQAGLNRIVAVKMILAGAHATGEELERFCRGAEAAARLQHPHIVQIHEIGVEDGVPYLSMEFVDGPSLADLLSKWHDRGSTGITATDAAALVRTLAAAMHYAHQQGIVHRDLKPANVLIADCRRQNGDGEPQVSISKSAVAKIADFGLAKLLDQSAAGTASGALLGTPSYMAPEQAGGAGADVGPPTDVYALGGILYELLTGRPPFRGLTMAETLEQVRRRDPVALRQLQPGVPRDLETICLKCLEKEPARRYASAAALAEELQRFLSGRPIHARPASLGERVAKWARRQRTVAALLAAVVLIMILGLSGVFWQWGRAEAGRAAAQKSQEKAELARDSERTLRQQIETHLYFHQVARAHHEWLSDRQARADRLLEQCSLEHRGWEWRCLRRMFHQELRTLRGHALDVRRVAFSPDGKRIASVGALWNRREPGSVIVWDAQSGESLQTFQADSGGFYGVAFSPDSERLAAANSVEGVAVWNLATGKKQFTAPGWHYDVAFSHSSGVLAAAGADGTVRIWDVDTGVLQHELAGDGSVFSITFSPNGKWIASTGYRGPARVWDVQSGEQVQVLEGAGSRCVAFTPDGRFLATCGYHGPDMGLVRVWEVDPWKQIVDERVPSGPVQWLCVSPDGRLLALTDARHGSVRVWETATGRERRILPAPNSLGVAFSPDGRTLASSGSDRTVKLWDMTRHEPVISRSDGAYASCLAFSPDSAQLAIAGGQNIASGRGKKTVQIWDVASTSECRLMRVLAGHQDWLTCVAYSADGKRLASADRAGAIKIWNASNGQRLRTMQAGDGAVLSVAFSPDGKRLAAGGREAVGLLWDVGTGNSLQTLVGHQGAVNQVGFSPDGRWIATASEDKTAKLWDATTGRVLHTLDGHDAEVIDVAFDSRGKLLATSGSDGRINLWETTAVQGRAADDSRQQLVVPSLVRTLSGHTAAVNGVSFSSDGTRLASSSDDLSVILWDVATGDEALTLTPFGRSLTSAVCFSPNGNILAAARRHQVTLWDASDPTQRDVVIQAQAGRRRTLAWHHDEAAACAREKDWFGAIFHWSQLIALEPKEPMYHFQRGNVYLNRHESNQGNAEQLTQVRADYERAVQLSGGLLLSGRGDQIVAPHIPFDRYDGFTIEAWVYGGYKGSIMVQGRSGDPENSIWLSPGRSFGTLASDTCGWESGRGDNYYDSFDQPLPTQWNHLCCVYDGDSLRLFLNGRLMKQKRAPRPGPLDPQRPLLIGGHQYKDRKLFSSGLLRSIRITSAPIYSSDFTPNDRLQAGGDTVMLYDFGKTQDWMTDSTVADLSGNGNDGTLNGAWIEQFQETE